MELPGFQYSEVKINLEVQLIRFYYDIFLKEVYYCNKPVTLDTLKAVKNAYSIENIRNGRNTNISFESPEVRCSYIYQYAACFASTVAYHYQKLLKGNPWFFEKIILQDTVNICCLGGGPATEFVAVAKILEEMMWKYCPRSQWPMKINATIIDVDSGWEQTVVKVLQSMPNLVDMNLMQFKLTFIQADLTTPLKADVLDVLKKADVVTMVKFLSSVRRENLLSQMLQEIIECMSESSVLFFLDSSGFQHYDVLRTAILSRRMIQFYGLLDYHIYRMSYPSLLECHRLYWGYFGMRYSAQQSKNYISAWYKW